MFLFANLTADRKNYERINRMFTVCIWECKPLIHDTEF